MTNKCNIGVSDTNNLINRCQSATEFRCDSGKCIPIDNECDGIAQCPDGSDETERRCENQLCSNYAFRCDYGACVSGEDKCNRKKDCADGSDETPELCGYENGTTFQSDPQVFIPTPNSCLTPQSPENGYIVYGANEKFILQRGQYVDDSVQIKYKCLSQYELVPRDAAYSYCVEKIWSSATPSCESESIDQCYNFE